MAGRATTAPPDPARSRRRPEPVREAVAEPGGSATDAGPEAFGPSDAAQRRLDLGGDVRMALGVAPQDRRRLGQRRAVGAEPAGALQLRAGVLQRAQPRAQARLAEAAAAQGSPLRGTAVERQSALRPPHRDAAGEGAAHQAPVVVAPAVPVPTAGALQRGAVPQDRRGGRPGPGEPGREVVLSRTAGGGRGGSRDPRLPLALVAVPRAERDAGLRAHVERRGQGLQRPRGQQVVGVEEHQPVAPREPRADRARRRAAAPGPLVERHGRPEAPRDVARPISRAVVHHQHLRRRQGLRQGRADRRAQRRPRVAAGDHDGDRRAHSIASTAARSAPGSTARSRSSGCPSPTLRPARSP